VTLWGHQGPKVPDIWTLGCLGMTESHPDGPQLNLGEMSLVLGKSQQLPTPLSEGHAAVPWALGGELGTWLLFSVLPHGSLWSPRATASLRG
jgi:hypothetical protein